MFQQFPISHFLHPFRKQKSIEKKKKEHEHLATDLNLARIFNLFIWAVSIFISLCSSQEGEKKNVISEQTLSLGLFCLSNFVSGGRLQKDNLSAVNHQ